jgi:asparagine synthase (glutamine-hydrolysing)
MYRDSFDVQIGREVAKACKQPHHVLVVGEEFLNKLTFYLEKAVYISDGYIGFSGATELYLNSLARNIAPVRLTGNYGGELLRGVRAFKHEFPKGKFWNSDIWPYLNEAQSTFQNLETKDQVTFALFHQAPSQGYGRRAIEKSQVLLRTPFLDNELVKLVYQAPQHILQNDNLSVTIISRYNPYLLKIPTDRGLLGDGSRLSCLVRKNRQLALIKGEYLASHGMPNWLAAISRFGFDGLLAKCFLGRNKFEHFRLWTQKRFADYITEILFQGTEDLREFLNRRYVERMVHDHLAGRKNYLDEIDKILTIALAKRILLKPPNYNQS